MPKIMNGRLFQIWLLVFFKQEKERFQLKTSRNLAIDSEHSQYWPKIQFNIFGIVTAVDDCYTFYTKKMTLMNRMPPKTPFLGMKWNGEFKPKNWSDKVNYA